MNRRNVRGRLDRLERAVPHPPKVTLWDVLAGVARAEDLPPDIVARLASLSQEEVDPVELVIEAAGRGEYLSVAEVRAANQRIGDLREKGHKLHDGPVSQ